MIYVLKIISFTLIYIIFNSEKLYKSQEQISNYMKKKNLEKEKKAK